MLANCNKELEVVRALAPDPPEYVGRIPPSGLGLRWAAAAISPGILPQDTPLAIGERFGEVQMPSATIRIPSLALAQVSTVSFAFTHSWGSFPARAQGETNLTEAKVQAGLHHLSLQIRSLMNPKLTLAPQRFPLAAHCRRRWPRAGRAVYSQTRAAAPYALKTPPAFSDDRLCQGERHDGQRRQDLQPRR